MKVHLVINGNKSKRLRLSNWKKEKNPAIWCLQRHAFGAQNFEKHGKTLKEKKASVII